MTAPLAVRVVSPPGCDCGTSAFCDPVGGELILVLTKDRRSHVAATDADAILPNLYGLSDVASLELIGPRSGCPNPCGFPTPAMVLDASQVSELELRGPCADSCLGSGRRPS